MKGESWVLLWGTLPHVDTVINWLSNEGFKVQTVNSVFDCEAAFHQHEPITHLVCDVDANGALEFIKKCTQETPFLTVIAVTSNDAVEKAVEALKIGANFYLTQPLEFSSFIQVIKQSQQLTDPFVKLKAIFEARLVQHSTPQQGLALLQQLVLKRRQQGLPVLKKEIMAFLPQFESVPVSVSHELWRQCVSFEKIQWETEPRRILLVEDDEGMGEGFKLILNQAGYHVAWLKLGHDIDPFIEEGNDFDVVLLDIFLPDSNGLEWIPLVKNKRPKAEIVVVTAHQLSELAVSALKSGALTFLCKPCFKTELLTTVAQAMQIHSQKQVLSELENKALPVLLTLPERKALLDDILEFRKQQKMATTCAELLWLLPELEPHFKAPNELLSDSFSLSQFIEAIL